MPEHLTNANDFSSLPTPTARDYKDTGPNTNYEKIAAKKRLAGTIALLPTPTAQAGKHGSTPDVTANSYGKNLWDLPHLLPLSGEITQQPSTDGNTSSDELPRPQ